MIKFHHNLIHAFAEPATWAGFGGVLTILGGQLDKPWATDAFIAAAACGIMAILVKQQVPPTTVNVPNKVEVTMTGGDDASSHDS